jgi:hypothetical protein
MFIFQFFLPGQLGLCLMLLSPHVPVLPLLPTLPPRCPLGCRHRQLHAAAKLPTPPPSWLLPPHCHHRDADAVLLWCRHGAAAVPPWCCYCAATLPCCCLRRCAAPAPAANATLLPSCHCHRHCLHFNCRRHRCHHCHFRCRCHSHF